MLPRTDRSDLVSPSIRSHVAAPAIRILIASLLGLLAALSLAGPAHADPAPGAPDPDAQRGWSFWESDGTAWLSAAKSAGESVPQHGAAIGWRFAAMPDGVAAEAPGGDIPVFEQVCGKEPAAEGGKRVAVAVDFGDAQADAYPGEQPPGEPFTKCVTGAESATGLDLLASVAQPRVGESGQVASVDGYPAKAGDEGSPVAAPESVSDASGEAEQGGGLSLPLVLGAVALVALLATAALLARRRARV